MLSSSASESAKLQSSAKKESKDVLEPEEATSHSSLKRCVNTKFKEICEEKTCVIEPSNLLLNFNDGVTLFKGSSSSNWQLVVEIASK